MEDLPSRRYLVAILLSVVVHGLLLALLPRVRAAVASLLPEPTPLVQADTSREPIRFELVELPDQRQESPSRRDVPGSDLSRRAHGGFGESSDRPGIRGTSPELRLSPGGQSWPDPSAAPVPPAPPREVPPEHQESPAENADADGGADRIEHNRGADAVLVPPPDPAPDPSVLLRRTAPLASPGALGPANVPDRTGGQVDLGPLSFDTQWYDWGPYAAEMIRRIRYHWRIPEIARFGVPGIVRIRFVIERSGRVAELNILSESGHPSMDFAARDAIRNASPLPPLPSDLPSLEREGVVITFYYNTYPPQDGEWR